MDGDAGMRAMMWGPANFTGMPPRRLMAEGAVLGVLGAGLVVGAGVAGLLTGHRTWGTGAAIVVTLALAVYLFFTNAGRVLVVAVAILGVALAWWVPDATADAVLAERGERRTVEVTAVHAHRYEGRDYVNYSCSVALPDGTPLETEAWPSCLSSSEPGDQLSMVFDPAGVVAPTDRILPDSALGAGARTAGVALLLAVVCFTAVVRSYP
jgi:hypothetical protein